MTAELFIFCFARCSNTTCQVIADKFATLAESVDIRCLCTCCLFLCVCSIRLAEMFDGGEVDLRGKAVLELGAGAGVPGLIAGAIIKIG